MMFRRILEYAKTPSDLPHFAMFPPSESACSTIVYQASLGSSILLESGLPEVCTIFEASLFVPQGFRPVESPEDFTERFDLS